MKMMLITEENYKRVKNFGYFIAIGPNEVITIKENNKSSLIIARAYLSKNKELLQYHWPCLANALELTNKPYSGNIDLFRVYWIYDVFDYDEVVHHFELDKPEEQHRWLDLILPNLYRLMARINDPVVAGSFNRLGFKKMRSFVRQQGIYYAAAKSIIRGPKPLNVYQIIDQEDLNQKFNVLLQRNHRYQLANKNHDDLVGRAKHDIYLSMFIMQVFTPNLVLSSYLSQSFLEQVNQY